MLRIQPIILPLGGINQRQFVRIRHEHFRGDLFEYIVQKARTATRFETNFKRPLDRLQSLNQHRPFAVNRFRPNMGQS